MKTSADELAESLRDMLRLLVLYNVTKKVVRGDKWWRQIERARRRLQELHDTDAAA